MVLSTQEIEAYILDAFEHVVPIESWGERSFFVNPQNKLKRGTYFATLKSKDGENDRASHLDRENVFRCNMGLPQPIYETHFGARPKRPSKGGIIEGSWDFEALDVFTPHPIYGWMGWVAILNPGQESAGKVTEYLHEAYGKAFTLAQSKILKL